MEPSTYPRHKLGYDLGKGDVVLNNFDLTRNEDELAAESVEGELVPGFRLRRGSTSSNRWEVRGANPP